MLILFVSVPQEGVLTLDAPKMKIVEFINSVDPDEVAHEPPHHNLHCLLTNLEF